MQISLTPELENQVRLRVESGSYNSASEVVSESVRLLVERDTLRQRMKDEIRIGHEQIQRGEGVTVTTEEQFISLIRGED